MEEQEFHYDGAISNWDQIHVFEACCACGGGIKATETAPTPGNHFENYVTGTVVV